MRDALYDIVKKEYVGPNPIKDSIQENGEEKLTISPLKRYFAGILFPIEQEEKDFHVEASSDNAGLLEKDDVVDDSEDPVTKANARQQSALGMTLSLNREDVIRIKVSCAYYKKDNEEYLRVPISWTNNDKPLDIPSKGTINSYLIPNDNNLELVFSICNRYEKNGRIDCTFTLENKTLCKDKAVLDLNSIYQTEFKVSSEIGFIPLRSLYRVGCDSDEDYMSNQLLYREQLNYSMGHGCATEWDYGASVVKDISTTVIPSYEVKPISPAAIEGLTLDMYEFSDHGKEEYIYSEISKLCSEYSKWIEETSNKIQSLEDHREVKTAQRHMKACHDCLDRMLDGLSLLKSDAKVRYAFQLMNRVMLLQQLHYNLPDRKWDLKALNDDEWQLGDDIAMPDIDDKKTWYNADNVVYGHWRPFQLAFVLINLRSMVDRNCEDRSKVDLIWFPTGGGKTEAYLGLSAYTIFIRRLLNKDDYGTNIIMRYTLRLLTSQQYSRAASMICACEVVRREKIKLLGKERFSIGLWVGGDNSYNKVKDALADRNTLEYDPNADNLFLILKCPWCGAEMGVIRLEDSHRVAGYEKVGRNGFQYRCQNENCEFSGDDGLPLITIDEQIYAAPPTLIIGTVDKFANLPMIPKARAIFGYMEKGNVNPPDLIIQDELHLISGPLGSMVGIYETLISAMCDNNGCQPKIIASTATISRAKEQCNGLYACKDKVFQFPPSGISYKDSFFAYENFKVPGRRYIGVVSSNSKKSSVMGGSNLIATLLYAGDELKQRKGYGDAVDPYWTNVAYFNSIRELGQMVTYYDSEIREQMKAVYVQNYGEIEHRSLHPICELTSRESSTAIPQKIRSLSRSLNGDNIDETVDLCVSTNMISVGVDIPRLGMMTVYGQPKTTSEYIQATSRVGRSSSKPGIVFVYYNLAKSRDRSHYEHFADYHSRLYCGVEPTSVTPFSKPARERALAAVAIGIVRLKYLYRDSDSPSDLTEEMVKDTIRIISDRVAIISPEEVDSTRKDLRSIFGDWGHHGAEQWGYAGYRRSDLPLMITNELDRRPEWEDSSFLVPTSMRNVDVECKIRIARRGLYEAKRK